ncbi:MAG TPA: formyltransferase family protein [Gemmatimonadales bacterium]|nr:formyltransferase family protein [Gemmatimonadales bacterium]
MSEAPLRVVLMAHDEDELYADGVASWLERHEKLVGVIRIVDNTRTRRRRIRREWRRSGMLGLADVLAWRMYHRLRYGREAARTRARLLAGLIPPGSAQPAVPVLRTGSPNGEAVQAFVRQVDADLMIALVKHILKPVVFAVPRHGTFVFHPGICPEYRNAHGCFWAIARGDRDRVGMTVLRIDEGVDTGPAYGYFRLPPGQWSASPIALQQQVVLENLEPIMQRLHDVVNGRAQPLDVSGRESGAWGQPRLTAWWRRPAARPTGPPSHG